MSEYYKIQWEKGLSKQTELFQNALTEAKLEGYKKAIDFLRQLNIDEAKISANYLETKYEDILK